VVIQTLSYFMEVPVEEFIAKMGRTLQVARKEKEGDSFVLDGYTPPHLLGLLRLYKTGRNIIVPNNQDQRFSLINCCSYNNSGVPPAVGSRPMSKTISAIELAEIGIKLTASRTTKFMDMGFKRKLFSSEISLPPLLLDEIRSCWLVNLAAFELCTGTASRNETENQAVCSYLVVLAMLMDREDDVHKLRSKRLVQGELTKLTNKEMLDFFKSLIKRISGTPSTFSSWRRSRTTSSRDGCGSRYTRFFLQELQDDRCSVLHHGCSCGYLQGTLLSEAALAAGRLLDH